MSTKRLLLDTLLKQLPVSEEQEQLPSLRVTGLRVALTILTIPIAFVILLPFAYLVVWTFWGTDIVGVLRGEMTGQWVASIALDPEWQQSLAYSIILATVVAWTGSLSLSIHFYSVRYSQGRLGLIAFGTVVLAILLPSIIYAIALQTVASTIGLPEIVLIFVGHLVVIMPIQYFVLESAQEGINSEVLYAGTTLGASHSRNFWTVYWPQNRSSIWSAAVVGFFLSFDELVIASFVIRGPFSTVPKKLWDRIDSTNDPAPAVISLLLFILYVLQVLVVLSIRRWNLKRRQLNG